MQESSDTHICFAEDFTAPSPSHLLGATGMCVIEDVQGIARVYSLHVNCAPTVSDRSTVLLLIVRI